MACVAIGVTAWAAGAQGEPDEEVREAKKVAERAAATKAVVRKVERNAEGPKKEQPSWEKFGESFEPADFSVVPEDWQEAGLDLDEAKREDGRLVQTLSNGLKVEFTVDPVVQRHLEEVLDDYGVPHGGIALLEPDTGRVIALVDDTHHKPKMPGLTRHATAPSASVYKIVTAAALIESAGIDPSEEVCYHGGTSHLSERNIKGSERLDDKCEPLGEALAWSINSIMAKLAYKHLDRQDMRVWAKRFGYNTDIPFELPLENSTAEIVADPFERARTAAGFWHTYLSPLHGALISASVKNDGLMMRPSIVERVETPDGEVLQRFEPRVLRRVMSEKTANVLAKLLQGTTSDGTARKYFAHRGAFPNDVTTAGKTGTLANDDPYLSFTWFVGFGSHDSVEGRSAAVAGLICNTPKWRIKGPWAASEALRKYFQVQERRAENSTDDQLAKK